MEREIYDEDHEAFRDIVKEFIKRHGSNAQREQWDAAGEIDRAWARVGGRWVLLGEAVPDGSGHARLIAENPSLEAPPERLTVARESGPSGAEPGGKTLVSWTADRK